MPDYLFLLKKQFQSRFNFFYLNSLHVLEEYRCENLNR